MSTQRFTAADVKRLQENYKREYVKPSKYKNQKTTVDNIVFDSKKEAARYNELKLLQKAGTIRILDVQPEYVIRVNDVLVATYTADFKWLDLKTGLEVVEDVKSAATRVKVVYRLKKKLVEAIYGIQIRET